MIKDTMERMEITVLFLSGYTREDILESFSDWSGGYEPNECDPEEDVEKYLHFAMTKELMDYFQEEFDDFYYYIYGQKY